METLLLGAMILGYLAAIFCINLSVTPSCYTTDMYTDIMVAVEMWEEKTLFPSNWVFGNQLYVFATPVLSALIYGITGNAFRSMGAAAFLMGVLVLASFFWMLGGIFPKIRERLFAIAAFLTVVILFADAFYRVNGWQLLFTMCAFYACYAIAAFLALGCYLRSEEKPTPVMAGLACLLSFAMGIQSLRQTAVMVLPMLGMEAWRMVSRARHGEPLGNRGTVLVFAISAANVLGLVSARFLRVNQYTIFGKMELVPLRQIPKAAVDSAKNAWLLFSSETVYWHQAALVLVVLAALVLVWRAGKPERRKLLALLALSVLTIWAIDTVTTMEVRDIYYFMLFPLVAYLLTNIYADHSRAARVLAFLVLGAAFLGSFTREVKPALDRVRDREWEASYEIQEDLLDKGFTTVYSSWNGCEKIAIASFGKLQAGFWNTNEDPFVPAPYLCDPAIYTVRPEEVAYVFYGEDAQEAGRKRAEEKQVEMTLVAYYPRESVYIYTAPVNLMEVFSEP